ncbi:MAG: ABC transporter substrate-binding protein [Candidatus Nezhaarchaeales archaeon]
MTLKSKLGAGIGVWIAVIIIIAIIAAAGGYYTGLSQAPPQQPTGPVLPDEIKIGVLLPLSGDLGSIGQKMLRGAQLAVDQINKAGGIAGRKVVLVVGDTKANPEEAVAEAQRLINEEGVKVIIGAATNPSTLAIAPIANERHVVVISPSSTSPEINKPENDPNNFVFRVIGNDGLQGLAMVAIAEELDYKTAVIVAINSDYGRGLADVINRTFTANGGQVLGVIYYDPAAGDYLTEMEQIKTLNPDVVFFVGYPESGSKLLKDAKTVGVASKWIAAKNIYNESMFDDPEVAEYMVGMYGIKPYSPTESVFHRMFVQAHIEKFGVEPGKYAGYTYDATMLAALAIAYAGDYNGTAIRDALFTVSKFFMGSTGPKIFDQYGDVPQDYEIWKVVYENGQYKFEIIGRWTLGIEGIGTITWMS